MSRMALRRGSMVRVEIVSAQVVIVDIVAHHVPGCDQDVVADGDQSTRTAGSQDCPRSQIPTAKDISDALFNQAKH